VDAAVQDAYLTHGPWSHVLEGSLLASLERAGYSYRAPETLRTVLGAGVTFGRLTGNGFLGYRPTVPYAWTLLRAADRPLMDVLTGWYRRPGAFAFGGRQDLRTHTRALCEHVVTAYPHDANLVLPFAVHTASFMSAAGLRQAVDLLTDRGAPPLPAVRALLQLAPTDPYAAGSDPVVVAAAVAAALTSR